MQLRRILYPTDFSPCARQAFAHAAALARLFGAELHLFHAITLGGQEPFDPMFYFPAADEAYAEAGRAVARELDALAADPLVAGLAVVQAQRRDFQPGPAILDYAADHDVDLVVMGTHGRRHVARLLLGSVAEEVVRRSACPVLSLRSGDDPTREHPAAARALLVPFDFSPPARRVFADAADLAQRWGARLHLLHVLEEPQWAEVYGFADFAEVARQRERLVPGIERRLRGIAAALAPGVPSEVEVRVGRPATEILAVAARPGIDLVVMASRGLAGVRRLLFGSTAEEVVRLSATPVMVIKPPAGDDAEWSGATAEVVEAQVV